MVWNFSDGFYQVSIAFKAPEFLFVGEPSISNAGMQGCNSTQTSSSPWCKGQRK